MSNYEIRLTARENLKGNWLMATLAFFIISITGIVLSSFLEFIPILGSILSIIISLILSKAIFCLSLSISNTKTVKFDAILDGKKGLLNYFLASILVTIFTILWSLLLIIPGIIKAFAYSQTFFILSENPEMSPLEAIKKSSTMMDGYKLDFFWLQLSFIGWFLLSALTIGIGFFFLLPYMYVSYANFYKKVSKNI